jgi:tRNA modification GTPase
VVVNKIDQQASGQGDCFSSAPWPNLAVIKVCAKKSTGIDVLQAAIEQKIQELFAQLDSPFLLNQRQFKLLTEIEARLEFIANSYSNGIHYELVAYKVKDLLEKVSELTGRNVTEQVLDTVFSEFCVGK